MAGLKKGTLWNKAKSNIKALKVRKSKPMSGIEEAKVAFDKAQKKKK